MKYLWLSIMLMSIGLQAKEAATIIGITGKVNWRTDSEQQWQKALLQQTLNEGQHIQTGRRSKTALLFTDQSQLRLNQNSLLIVRSVLDEQGKSTRFRLNQGRAWVKSKNIPDKLIMETPTAVAAIRGTDWDIEVSENGTTRLTVLHGSIHLSNNFGALQLIAGEQGLVEPGKAPVKITVVNPQNRIQWVTQYQSDSGNIIHSRQLKVSDAAQLARLLTSLQEGQYQRAETLLADYPESPEKSLIEADIMVFGGELQKAISLLSHSQFKDDPALQLKKVKIQLQSGQPVYLENILFAEQAVHNGDVAFYEGQWREAENYYLRATELEPQNPNGYFGLGKVYGAREYIPEAIATLGKAITLKESPVFKGLLAEQFINSNQFQKADTELSSALVQSPDNAVLLTGLGIWQLKKGNVTAAIKQFIKAGTLQPKLARIHIYLAVARYRQGNIQLALESLSYASELDDKDPLPYFLRSTIESERYLPYNALTASQKAIERLPNLKSLNQLADDRKGSNNLGAAIANYGMNEWALSVALDSYDPYWSGSPLFLAQRITREPLVSNSERLKGLLLDPTVFGASNRLPGLIKTPGHYFAVSDVYSRIQVEESRTNLRSPSLSGNGYFISPAPIAWFSQYTTTRQDSDSVVAGSGFSTEGEPDRKTFGLGSHITDQLRLFYFDERGNWDTEQETTSQAVGVATFTISSKNAQLQRAAGLSYKVSPDMLFLALQSQFENKRTSEQDLLSETITEFPPSLFINIAQVDIATFDLLKQRSQHLKGQFRRENWHFGYGFESIEHNYQRDISQTTNAFSQFFIDGELFDETRTENTSVTRQFDSLKAQKWFFNFTWDPQSQVTAQASLQRHNLEKTGQSADGTGEQITFTDREILSLNETTVSAGFTYSPDKDHKLKLARLTFIDNLSEVSLDDLFIADIPYMNRYINGGGKQTLWAAEWEFTGFRDSFFKVFHYRRNFNNQQTGRFEIPRIVNGLTDVRNVDNQLDNIFTDDYQLPNLDQDIVQAGRVHNTGVNFNHYLTEHLAIALRQEWQHTERLDVPDLRPPISSEFKQHSRMSIIYSSPHKFKMGLSADYYDFHDGEEVFRDDGWYVKASYVQEFFNRHLWLFSQIVWDHTAISNSRNINVGLEYRF